MGIIGILLLILICGYIFYKYLMSKFVHFMNTFILVPPQRLINDVIKAINKIIEGLNKPFRAIRNLDVMGGLKIFGKKLSIKPFTKIIPDPFIPLCPYLPYQCIDEPEGYNSVWGYSTPKECKTKTTNKKKRKLSESTSGVLSNFILVLIIMLFILFYIGNHEGIMNNIKSNFMPAALPTLPAALPTTTALPTLPAALPTTTDLPTMPGVPTLAGVPTMPGVPTLPAP